MSLSRRAVLAGTASIAAFAASGANAAMGPNDKFDLIIKGGDVLDPSQNLRGKRDIGIRFGLIEAVENDIPADRAQRVMSASGKLVTPGLIDLHSHVFPYGSAIGIPADELVAHQGTTTCVSAGDAGANNIAIFRRHIVAQTRTRLLAFVHIANFGLASFPVPELYNIDFAQVDAAAKAIAENADIVLGTKVRMSENVVAKNGLEPLKRAILACERSGTNGKVMCHIGGVETVALMSQILDLLRPGDILTHAYSGAPNIGGQFTNIVQDGKLLPAALAAKQRGVIFDVGHGGGSFDYTVCEAAMREGAGPDTISSDIHVFSGNTPGMPYLTWVMSKFLGLGFPLEQVVAMATSAPAKIINRGDKLGTLKVGAPADVALLDVVEGPVSFVDTRNNTREGKVHLRPFATVAGGVPFGRPYMSPFATR
ncbi:dihydroorotase [Variibacter gotjawalensis]|uniref:Dihydroorotase n=1 Tax=Variibacter gotjawalensis TaxID=1333996 RepID=A0A0S3PQZ6_9BRAD|nr:amidohydrolase/deacetylase family metallohydrolase [Variibacter gotjawalensis]NIK48631.1 dihydroorotase [Variibacter gotjawalensis]RZS50495.1 dihydroorotase [Variibacter gotjawalensis]BAT58329.1 dihydroorotase [Variibacter gotjawalensis]